MLPGQAFEGNATGDLRRVIREEKWSYESFVFEFVLGETANQEMGGVPNQPQPTGHKSVKVP